MSIRCAQCGEELLGAVNRCWRCGQAIEVPADGGVPPIVRAPVPVRGPPSAAPLEAQLVDGPPSAAASSVRGGSPFARTQVGTWQHWRRTVAKEWTAATLSAWAAVIIAVYGWVLLPFSSVIAFTLAIVSLALGIFGLWGRHRPAAVVALLLCCPLLALAAYRTFVDIFTWSYGYHPFQEAENADTWPPR